MEHKNRWLTRLYLMKLEDRTQPGSILSAGIDVGALAGVIDLPQQQDASRQIKRLNASEDIQISAPLSETTNTVTAPMVNTIHRNETPTQAVQTMSTNPALHQPASDVERLNVGRERGAQSTGQRFRLPTPTIHPFSGPVTRGTGTQLSVDHVDNNSGSGTRAINFVNYDEPGTGRVDQVNDVARGAGAFAGQMYTAGGQGRSGTLKRYDASGALLATTNFSFLTPGNRVQLTGVDVSADGSIVYVTGRENVGGSAVAAFNFIHAVPAALGPPVPGGARLHNFPAGGAGTIENLEDITVSAFGAFDIHVTGSQTDPTGSYSTVFFGRYSAGLAMPMINEDFVDFVEDADGYSVVVDPETGLQIYGGDAETVGINDGLNFAIANDNITIPYAYADSCGGLLGTSADPDNGEWGEVIVNDFGGVEADDRLYLSGSLADPLYSPMEAGDTTPPDNLYRATVRPATGDIVGGVYDCLVIGGLGALDGVSGDYTSRGSDATAAGIHVVAGSADFEGVATTAQSIHRAHQTEFDAAGAAVVSMRTYGDGGLGVAFNQNTDARGIAVLTTGEVAIGGVTNTARADFAPGLTAANDDCFGPGVTCADNSGGPPSDGFYASDDLPFGG